MTDTSIIIKINNGKWTINGKTFNEMSRAEKLTLSAYIDLIKQEIEDEKNTN